MNTAIAIPETEPLEKEHSPLLAQSRAITVIPDAPTYEQAALCKRALSGRRLFILDFFKPMKTSIDVAKKTVLDRERLVLAPIQTEESRIGGLLVSYDDEQEKRRQREQKAVQENAQIAEAEQHEALGDHVAADQALEGKGLVNLVVAKETPKVEGLTYRETWAATVTDKLTLIKAVADGKAPLAFVEPNYTVLNQAARAMKEELNLTPGVKV